MGIPDTVFQNVLADILIHLLHIAGVDKGFAAGEEWEGALFLRQLDGGLIGRAGDAVEHLVNGFQRFRRSVALAVPD